MGAAPGNCEIGSLKAHGHPTQDRCLADCSCRLSFGRLGFPGPCFLQPGSLPARGYILFRREYRKESGNRAQLLVFRTVALKVTELPAATVPALEDTETVIAAAGTFGLGFPAPTPPQDEIVVTKMAPTKRLNTLFISPSPNRLGDRFGAALHKPWEKQALGADRTRW